MNNGFYFTDIAETTIIELDFPPEIISVPSKEIFKPTLEYWSCWGFLGSTVITPIRSIVDEGYNTGNADITLSGFLLTTTYESIISSCSSGKIKFFDDSTSSKTLYTVSLEQQSPPASYIIGNDNYVKYNFKLKIC
jgi:hypothetical protein